MDAIFVVERHGTRRPAHVHVDFDYEDDRKAVSQ
jgi:hypothetical protein